MPILDSEDTIAAIASPSGGAWRGLVRVSGPRAFAVVGACLAGLDPAPLLAAHPLRRSAQLWLHDLDQSVAVDLNLWPGPRTYTGQPLVEVGLIGAPVVLRAVLAELLRSGARPAEPGEFTLRAFLAGRIDLTQAEAVLGVIDAGSPEQLAGALRQLAGGLGAPLARLRDDLADTLAHLEANLDFADEADVDPLGRARLIALVTEGAATVADLAGRLGTRDRATARSRVVLAGPPNAGKSRLFNALVRAERALVAPVAGTTRDYLEAPCDCGGGVVVDLVDTAGVELAADAIAHQAQGARADQIRAADLVLDCLPARAAATAGTTPNEATHPQPPDHRRVATRADEAPHQVRPALLAAGWLVTSAATGEGVADLRLAIASAIAARQRAGTGEFAAATAARCTAALDSAARALAAAQAGLTLNLGDELIAVDLRQAIDDLGHVVGALVTDDLLDRIFRRFCIGK